MNTDRFKFRAWNKEEKVMHYNAEYTYDSMYGTPIISHDSFACLLDDDNFVIEQCTGLKDKNGKLIFDGDVFEATVLNSYDGDSMVDKRIRGQVAYFTDGTCFTFAAYAPFNLSQIEIIGNIHEMESEND